MHTNKIHHVTTINRVAEELGEDETIDVTVTRQAGRLTGERQHRW
jgi:HD superfamily phosphodiesterase